MVGLALVAEEENVGIIKEMSLKAKICLAVIPLALLFSPENTNAAASVEIKNFNIKQERVIYNTSTKLDYDIDLRADTNNIKNECESDEGDILWHIIDTTTQRSVASTKVKSFDFLNDRAYQYSSSFSFSPTAKQTSATFQLIVYCPGFFGGPGRQITASRVETVAVTDQSKDSSFVEIKFGADKQNQKVQPGSNVKINFNLQVKASEPNLRNTCNGDTLEWSIFMVKLTNPRDTSNSVATNGISFSSFGAGKTIPMSIPVTVKALNEDFGFFARIRCDRKGAGTDTLAESSLVRIYSGGAGSGGGGDSGGGGGTGGGSGGGGGAGGDDGGTETRTYSFSLDNPFGGGATTIFDFINVITTWIFNLSIPIAVVLIMYAGLLFLTAGGSPKNFQKAKDVLKYTVLGLAILLIGKGFVTLIISILELGGPSGQPPLEAVRYDCNNKNECVRNPNGRFTTPNCNAFCAPSGGPVIKSPTPTPAEPLQIATMSLSNAAVDVEYFKTLTLRGGTSPYKWSFVRGSLPPGMSFNEITGTISGVPTTAGAYEFRIGVSDSSKPQQIEVKDFTLTVNQ